MKLKKILFLFELVGVILPTILLGSWFYKEVQEATVEIYELKNAEVIRLQALSVQQHLENMMDLIRLIAEGHQMSELHEVNVYEQENLSRISMEAVRKTDYLQEIYFIDKCGEIIASNKQEYIGDVTGLKALQDRMQNHVIYSSAVKDSNQEVTLGLIMLLENEEQRIGGMVGIIDTDYLTNIMQENEGAFISQMLLVDRHNNIITRYSNAQNSLGRREDYVLEGSEDDWVEYYRNEKGEQVAVYYQELPGSEMKIVSIVDTTKLKKWVSKPLEIGVLMIIFLIILLVMIKRIFFKAIIKEIDKLKYKTKYFHYIRPKCIKEEGWIEEFTELNKGFNQMLSVIQEKNNKLLETNSLYEMLFKTMQYHVYQIEIQTGEVTHRGNLYEQIEFRHSYQGIESIYPSIYLEVLEVEKIDVIHQALLQGKSDSAELDFQMRLMHQKHYRWFHLQAKTIQDVEGKPYKVAVFIMDINERKQRELQFEELALKDPLTGLYNKISFENYVRTRIEKQDLEHAYMIMLDLDNFKAINDAKGHRIADELLKRAAHVLQEALRLADEESIAARFGGDEFMMWLESPVDIHHMLKKILEKFNHKQDGEAISTFVGASIGGSRWHEGMSYKELFDKADQAMYATKQEGKNHYTLY